MGRNGEQAAYFSMRDSCTLHLVTLSLTLPGAGGHADSSALVQSSMSRFGTRSNSLTLLVTNATPKLTACAAIRVSSGPMGVPALSRAALIRP